MRNRLLMLLALVLMGSLAFAVGQKEQAAGAQTQGSTNLILMHDKGGNPNYQPFYEEVGKKAKEATGVGFTPTPYPTTDVYMAAVRAALPTNKAPELFTWWSTYRMKELIDQGLVADLTDLWDKHKDEYPQGIRDAFTFNNKVYGLPYSIEYWGVWYNKAVFAKYNLSVPKTWDEFLKVCATLKANKVTPMAQTVQGRWPTFIIFEELVARQNPQLYVDLCEGKKKYTDPEVKKAFTIWADLIKKGYFTDPSADLFSDVPRLFNSGEVAMVPCGSWYLTTLTSNGVPESNVDIFIMPPHNPSAGKVAIMEAAPVLVSKNTPNLDAAKKVIDWWMTPEGNLVFAKLVNQFPPNSKADISFMPTSKANLASMLTKENYRILNRYWEATPTPICEAAVDKFAEFILNPNEIDKVLNDLDKIANDYWAKNK